MFDNTTFVSNHSITSNGISSFSVANSIKSNAIFIDHDRREQDKKNKNQLTYYKPISWSLSFNRTLKIKHDWISLHIGDIIDFITKYTGIKSLIIKLTKGKCGCEARRKKFNNWFKIPFIKIWFDSHDYDDQMTLMEDLREKQELQEQKIELNRQERKKAIMIQQGLDQYNGENDLSTREISVRDISSSTSEKKSGCGCQSKMKKTVIVK